jgi:sugar phosphate isomerase/epimerase
MQKISRREFLGTSAAGALAAGSLFTGVKQLGADPLGVPIGCQVFPIREQLMQDFDGTLRQVASIGYRIIEFCSPPSFVTMGFGPIANWKASEILAKINSAGLKVVSCHFQFRELKEHLDERIAFAVDLGLKNMIVATLAIPPTAPMDEWRRAADEVNKFGEATRKAGIQLGFHNHGFEFQKIDGVLIYDELMSRFDRQLVRSQFQVANAFDEGYDPAFYLKKYPGRFLSLHLQDYLTSEKKNVPVGQGSIHWKEVFAAARHSGIQYIFVEMDMDALKASYPYLHGLQV